MTITESHRGTLSPTRCYERREYRIDPPEPWETDGRCFTLTIMLTAKADKSAKYRTKLSVYAVEVEWEYLIDFGLWSFLLENLREPDDEGPLRCVVDSGRGAWCTCEAGGFDRRRLDEIGCKHRAALADIVTRGLI